MYLKKAQIKITKYYVHFSSFEEKVSDDQAQKLLWITFLIQPKIYSYEKGSREPFLIFLTEILQN